MFIWHCTTPGREGDAHVVAADHSSAKVAAYRQFYAADLSIRTRKGIFRRVNLEDVTRVRKVSATP